MHRASFAIAGALAVSLSTATAQSYGPDAVAATCVELGHKAGTSDYDYCFQSLTRSYASRGLSGSGKPASAVGIGAVAPPSTTHPAGMGAVAPPRIAPGTIQAKDVVPRPEPKTYYEREAVEYAKIYTADTPPSVQEYWRHRLDLADRLDKGQISLGTANELLRVYSDQATRELAAAINAEEQRAAQAQARASAMARDSELRAEALQAIVAAQEKAAAEQRSQALLIEGLRMMTGAYNPQPPPQRGVLCVPVMRNGSYYCN